MSLSQIQASLQAFVLDKSADPAPMLPRLQAGYGISGESRLDLYHGAYRARLLEALGVVYERIRCYVGDDDFAAAGSRYVALHPSRSRNLRDYGEAFPGTLRACLPDRPEVAELATMDWSLHRAFDAPDAALLDHAALAALSEDDWAGARLVFHPAVSMGVFEWNAPAIWHALDRGVEPPPAARLGQPTAHLFWRRDLAGRFRSLDAAEHAALRDLASGLAFAAICERVPATQAASWLCDWIREELLSAVVPAGRTGAGRDYRVRSTPLLALLPLPVS